MSLKVAAGFWFLSKNTNDCAIKPFFFFFTVVWLLKDFSWDLLPLKLSRQPPNIALCPS